MDVRKKLVEIVCDALESDGCIGHCNYSPCFEVERVVNALIDNGVTVQENVKMSDELLKQLKNAPITIFKSEPSIVTVHEWISVEDRLPEHRDVVLCFMKFGEQRILQWDNVSSLWLGYGHGDDWQKADVTNWMPLPERPEREKTEE